MVILTKKKNGSRIKNKNINKNKSKSTNKNRNMKKSLKKSLKKRKNIFKLRQTSLRGGSNFIQNAKPEYKVVEPTTINGINTTYKSKNGKEELTRLRTKNGSVRLPLLDRMKNLPNYPENNHDPTNNPFYFIFQEDNPNNVKSTIAANSGYVLATRYNSNSKSKPIKLLKPTKPPLPINNKIPILRKIPEQNLTEEEKKYFFSHDP